MGNSDHGTIYMRVGGDDGELRPWYYIYVYSIESRLIMRVSHPEVELRENHESISHRCYSFEVAFVCELTKETIHLPLGCLQGGSQTACFSDREGPGERLVGGVCAA